MKVNLEPMEAISYIQILNESIEMYEILISLTKTEREISSLLSIPMIPFLAFMVDGIIQIFPEYFDYSENDLNLDGESYKKLVRKIRVGHKLLSDKRYSKKQNIVNRKQIENYNNLTSDYNNLQNLVIKLFGQEDYGIFRYKHIDFATNIQGHLYLDTLTLNSLEEQGKKLTQLSSSLSSLLSNFVIGSQSALKFDINSDFIVNADINDFDMVDFFLFDFKRKNIFNEKLNSNIQALLHSHLCQLNYLGEVFPNVFSGQVHCFFRFKLVAFLEAIKVLKNTINNESEIDIYKDLLLKIINGEVYQLLSSNRIRNNIAHYQLRGYDPQTFINENSIVSIIEFETQENISSFYDNFENEFKMVKRLLNEILFN